MNNFTGELSRTQIEILENEAGLAIETAEIITEQIAEKISEDSTAMLMDAITEWVKSTAPITLYQICPECGREFEAGSIGCVDRRRMNTAYENDESNFVVCCLGCFEECQKLWADRWQEYYNSVM